MVTLEQPQKAEKRFYAEAETNPNVDIYWHTPAFGHKDTYPLSVLARCLYAHRPAAQGAGPGQKIGDGHLGNAGPRKYAGEFSMGAEITEGNTPEMAEQEIYRLLSRSKPSPYRLRTAEGEE